MRRISSILTALILSVIVALSASASMALRVPHMEAAAGSTVDVAIDVTGADAVGALQFDVNYDASVLTAMSARAGALATDALIEVRTDKPGRIFIAMATTNGISGEGTVAVATFKVIGAPGTVTTIEPSGAQAWDVNTQREMLMTPEAGQLTVTEQSGWLWIAIGAAILILLLFVAWRRSRKTATL